jgi:hypothetical protein
MHCGYGDVRNLIFKPLIVIFVTKGSINEKFDFYVGSLEGFFSILFCWPFMDCLDYTTKMVKEFISFHQQFQKFIIEKCFMNIDIPIFMLKDLGEGSHSNIV